MSKCLHKNRAYLGSDEPSYGCKDCNQFLTSLEVIEAQEDRLRESEAKVKTLDVKLILAQDNADRKEKLSRAIAP